MEALKNLTQNSTPQPCVVCFSGPEKGGGYQLESCGHLHCVDCFERQIEFASLPLVCSEEVVLIWFIFITMYFTWFQGCHTKLVAADFLNFSHNQELMMTLLGKSIQHKLSDPDSEIKPCLTPDCKGLFKKDIISDETKPLDPTLCRLCGVYICPRLVIPWSSILN